MTRIGKSDHPSIEQTLDDSLECYIPRHSIEKNYYRGNYVKTKELLSAGPWNKKSDMNLQDSCDFFYENINTVIDQTIPETSTTKTRSKPI